MDLSIDAVRRAIGRALQPISDGVLEAWTSGNELGTNVRALRMELQCAQWMLNNTRGNRHSHGREIQDPALAKLLQELLGLSYRADDALDELDYFRIQDELDGSYSAADEHGSGYLRNLILNARHTVQAIRTAGKNLPRFSAGSPVQNDANSIVASTGSRLLCCCTSSNKVSRREVLIQTPKLRFDRVEISREMKEIVEQLKHVCAKVSTILNNLEFLDSNCSVAQCISTRLCTNDSKNRWQTPMHRDAMSRPSKPIEPRFNGRMIEPRFNGRMELESKIIHDITMGECCVKDLTVLPIVGPGGIGKTTLAQHIFQELRAHFEVTLWVTVSINFNVYRLTKDIAYTLTDDIRDSPDKLVEERLKSKRFLLVLDDLWSCGDDEWRRFLVPFRRGQTKGSVILVTTRFRKIALMVKTTDSLIELEGLEHEAFRELFMSYAFGDDMQAQNDSGLIAIGDRILQKLKGSPLVAKTVGQLLRNNLTLDHWTRVLESKEWEFQIDDDNGIMAALKLSFDSLPSHLQQCLTYCALFPEDYKFRTEEIIHFWIGLDILHPSGVNERIEDIGLSVLKDLAVLGFFRKEEENGHTCYSIHDLIHDLALKVSAHDCLSIYSSGVRYLKIPPSVRHMAINIDDSSVKDKMTFASCKEDFSALFKRVKVENLHTLMLFGNHQGSFVKIFGDLLFNKARALRVIFISGETCSMEDYLLSNIWKFVHLWYLRIGCASLRSQLPNISTLYHLRVLDLQGCYKMCCNLPRDMGNLIKLRHLLIPDSERHSSIFKVGRLKELQELRRFEAKREIQGFELRQIGHLQDLRGSLQIENLERVEVKEANEAKLVLKNHLRRLTLDWNINRPPQDPACEEQVLEGLKPGSNLLELCISGHGGATCPSWLGVNLSVKNLESLRLDSVAWKIYPAIGELWLVNDHGEKLLSDTSNQGFRNLKRIELVNLVGLKKWVVNHQLFFHLEVLIIKDCPELVELSSRYSTCIGHEQQTWFPRLQELMIDRCPKLLSLPPVPWTCAALSVRITGVDLCFERLVYKNDNGCASSLEIEGKDSLNSASWMALDFHNLSKLEKLKMVRCPPMPLHLFRMLFSLKTLEISYSNIVFWPVEDESPIQYLFPVESMRICGLGANGKELTQLLSFMPKLLELLISDCERIAGLGIMEQRQKATPSSNEVETQIGWLQNSIEKEEIAVEGLLLLPPQLHELLIAGCPNLIILLPDSLVDDKESLLAQRAGCLQGLLSLLSLEIRNCPKCLSYLSSSPCFPFPNSLQKLSLGHVEGMETLLPLSNLTTLTELEITDCGDLRNEGLLNLLTPGSLTKLSVSKTPNFFCSGPLELHEEGLYFSSSRLRMLLTDDAGVLTAPICSLLSSSLTSLFLFENKEMEYFTKGQEESLMLLTSLQEFGFYDCDRLQCLPAVLHRLPNLKRLEIASSPAIQMLPKGGLPSSLEELKIKCCPAIRTLPKVGLPYSLRVLNVLDSNNEELRMQCRKLIGIIPIVEA